MDNIKNEFDEVVKKLIDLKVLIPMSDLKVYHGRAGDGTKWKINPQFNNGGNATGNANVFSKSVLYTSSQDVAFDFAYERSLEKRGTKPEVHRIVPKVKKALIINRNVDLPKLISAGEVTYDDLMIICCGRESVTKVVPLKFEDFHAFEGLNQIVKNYVDDKKTTFFSKNDISQIYNEYCLKNANYLDKNVVEEYLSAFTTRNLMCLGYWNFLLTNYLDNNNLVRFNNDVNDYPINSKFLSAILSDLKIVGSSVEVMSATLNRIIDTVVLFDLKKVEDEKTAGKRIQDLIDFYGHFANKVKNFTNDSELLDILKQDKPELIIKNLTQNNQSVFSKYLKKDAHVWEGFTIGQHTESVLRAFDEAFSLSVPEHLKPFARFTMLVHDIDKDAVKNAEKMGKNKQEILQIRKSIYKEVFNECKIDLQYQNLIWGISTQSQKYTTQYYVKKEAQGLYNLIDYCEELLIDSNTKYGTTFNVNDKYALANVCRILQTCDSLSYTRIGVTRDLETNLYYYNANDNFTQNFDLDKLRFKEDSKE